jgi:lipoate-protein ligase A
MIDEPSQDEILSSALVKQRIHHIQDWRKAVQEASPVPVNVDQAGKWLNYMFGTQTPGEENGESVAQTVVHTVSNTPVGEFLNRKH